MQMLNKLNKFEEQILSLENRIFEHFLLKFYNGKIFEFLTVFLNLKMA